MFQDLGETQSDEVPVVHHFMSTILILVNLILMLTLRLHHVRRRW